MSVASWLRCDWRGEDGVAAVQEGLHLAAQDTAPRARRGTPGIVARADSATEENRSSQLCGLTFELRG